MKHTSSARRWSKTASLVLCGVFLLFLLGGCAEKESHSSQETVMSETETSSTGNPSATEQPLPTDNPAETEKPAPTEEASLPAETSPTEELTMMLRIDNAEISVRWEDNESVEALKDLIREAPLTINMSMYGGFEQVGSLGTSLPRNDAQTTTEAGDIVLYSGSQIVVFYGSNSWAYTKLGHVELSAAEMSDLLSHGDVTITLFAE
jgi:hypothetical protein